jgi:hypothetical protein|nr:MAG TPA: hypothetical protein [Caudoviricetes sp.]
MTTLPDVKAGRMNLEELVRINQYLEMNADIEYYNTQKQLKEGGRKHYGRSPRTHR